MISVIKKSLSSMTDYASIIIFGFYGLTDQFNYPLMGCSIKPFIFLRINRYKQKDIYLFFVAQAFFFSRSFHEIFRDNEIKINQYQSKR